MLDMRKISLGDTRVAGFAVKRDAARFARLHGWRTKDAIRAQNHFNLFWVVAQGITSGVTRVLLTDGSWRDFKRDPDGALNTDPDPRV